VKSSLNSSSKGFADDRRSGEQNCIKRENLKVFEKVRYFCGITCNTCRSSHEGSLYSRKTSDSLEHKLYEVGSLIFAYGKEQRGLVLNPFDEIDRPEVAYRVPEIIEPAQFKRLLETAEEEVPELIPFLAMAGFAAVRRSELVKNTPRTRS
jgi:site-specific recombinase XerD